MTERTNKRTKEFFREWLEKLQQESWQLELLISGLALFGIWESRAMLDNFEDFISLNATGALEAAVDIFLLFLKISWVIFFMNLLVHIIVRGLWIGAIGLRYVSGDIEYDELGYSQRFESFLRKKVGDFDDYIERLEKLSSIIFSFTFLLMFFFLSILSLSLVFAVLGQLAEHYNENPAESPLFMSMIMIIFLLCLIVFIDFITFGSLKKVESPVFSKVYFWIYRLVGFLTLSFLYRPLLYNFIDDKYTRRLVIIAIPYIIFVSIFLPRFGFDAYNYDPSFSYLADYEQAISANSFKYLYYDDLREQYARMKNPDGRNPIIHWVSLGAYEYTDQTLAKVFIKSSSYEDETFEKRFPHLVPFKEKGFRSIFNTNKRDNEYLDSIEMSEVTGLRFMRKVVRGELDKITEEEKNEFGDRLEYYQKYDSNSLDSLREDFRDQYSQKKWDYYENYLEEMIEAKRSLITLKVDSFDISDSLDCSFFVHPNMGEKGILCYFPISQFKSGKHDMTVKIEHAEEEGDGSWHSVKSFPFMINRKIRQ